MENVMQIYVYNKESGAQCDKRISFDSAIAAFDYAEKCGADNIEILFAPGKHHFAKPIEILSGSSLAQKASISIKGSASGETQISGTQIITPTWQVHDKNILVADIGPGRKIDAFYVNNKRQIMARYPNEQPGTVLEGYSKDAISPERVARWKNPAGGYIRALHDREWGSNSYIIDGKNSDNTLLYHWVGDNNRGCEMHSVKRMVENIFEELDDVKEWYYNVDSGMLYYWPDPDVDLDTAEYEIVTTEEFFRLAGTEQAPIKNISFENIHFMRTYRTLFSRPYERPLRGDWGIVRAGAIFLENTENITIQNSKFTDIGGNAVTMSAYNRQNRVLHSDFLHIGATGVLMTGLLSAVRNPSMYDGNQHKTTISDFTPGPKSNEYPREILVADNYFYDIGTYEKQTAAVCMSISSKVTVSRNTVHHTSRAGINIHDGTFGGHIIENNDLFDCVTETADHGPINCWGRDRYWSVPQHDAMGYYGKEKRPFALLDAIDTTIIRGNRVSANYAFGIDIDDGASNYDIYDNLCIGVGIKLRDGFDRKVHNNILIGAGFEIHMTFATNNDLIFNNIVCSSKAYNMLCVNPGATTLYTNNLYWNMGNPVHSLPKDDYLSEIADPMFADFEGNIFSVLPESPALKKGFVNFPVDHASFGRADCPNPPPYRYVATNQDETYQFHDVILSNISNEGIRSAAGLPDLNGVYIVSRDVLGLFCKLGLPIGVGDVIRKINDIEINNIEDFLREFDQIPLNVPTTVHIFRSQLPMEFEFVKQTNDYQSICEEATDAWMSSAPLLYQ